MTKLADITSGQQNCKVLARITRLWDSKNMNSRAADPLISIDGVILDEDVHSLLAYFIFSS
jgi:replication factor A1